MQNQRSSTWMGCNGHDSRSNQDANLQRFHSRYTYAGPSTSDLILRVPFDRVHDEVKQAAVERKMELMRYTSEGEGCRFLDRDLHGRTSSIRPGPQAHALHTATNAVEAAEANKFYPHQEYKIMRAAMSCGPEFPLPVRGPATEGSKEGSPVAFLDVIGTAEILDSILSYLCYTDRATLSQTCRAAAIGVSNFQTVWFINQQDFGDAEFNDDEFDQLVESGEMWDVSAPRGAKVLMITMAAREYDPSTGYRPYSSYMTIAAGMLRLMRAMDNRGRYVEHLILKNVPFVDHKVLAGIVEFCPKLRKLEVPGCEQFTLFSVAPFLDFLKDVQKERGTYIEFDAAPAFYKGGRWTDYDSKKCDGSTTHDRKGTFGVAAIDPGCDIPTALCKVLVYHVLPAIKAAGQLHMVCRYSSLFREWNEALPGPRLCIPLIITCWMFGERIEFQKSTAETKWRSELDDAERDAPFEQANWPTWLVNEVSELQTLRHWTMVRATCGDNGWRHTADRGFYSCDYQCTAGNFSEHRARLICDRCNLSLPRIFFNSGSVCEGCRLGVRVDQQENDHLQYWKRRATEALGYGKANEAFRTNAESNFPFEAFQRDENGDLPVKTRADFVRIIDSAPSLRTFIDAAAQLDKREELAGFYKGRKTIRQLDHPDATYPTTNDSMAVILARHPYRRALTHEEYAKCSGMGWKPLSAEERYKW